MFLFSKSGILRGETFFSAELSDCFLVSNRNPSKDPHTWDALIMTILDGKTNRLNKIYGRAMRSKNVLLCPLGALGFYLLSRFQLTQEFEESNCPDFTDNKAWYDIKLLVGFGNGAADHTKEQKPTSYSKCIKKILKDKQISSNHYSHIGRVIGAAELQYLEVDDEEVRQLGNWQVTVRDLCYSTKLPLRAMRFAAKFYDCDGMYFCPRSQVIPPDQLLNQIFPFADEQLARVLADIEENGRNKSGVYLGSATGFLEMLMKLKTIILQDAAAIVVLHPERASHAMFTSFPIFRSGEFIVSFIVDCCLLFG